MKLFPKIFIILIFLFQPAFAETLKKIDIIGNQRIPNETIIMFSGVNLNDDITENQLNDILKNLYDSNFFENVSVKFDDNNLTILVKEFPIIDKIIYKGIKAKKIFEYYENKYGTSDLDSTVIDSIIGDLKDAGFNQCGFPLKESKDQKNFLDEMFQDASCYAKKDAEKNSFDVVEKDSNEESVVNIEKPNNIILPDNN